MARNKPLVLTINHKHWPATPPRRLTFSGGFARPHHDVDFGNDGGLVALAVWGALSGGERTLEEAAEVIKIHAAG